MSRKVTMRVGLPSNPRTIEVTVPDSDPDPWGTDATLRVVGSRQPRLEAAAKVTGKAKYTYDVNLPGMLYARVLRSPHPSSRIVKVDASKVKAHPAVRAVETFEGRTVRFAGEEVAALAALSPEAAAEALSLFKVEYALRPWVTDLEKAREPQAPAVFEGSNLRPQPARTKGDALAALASSERIVEQTFRTQVQTHCSLETHGVVARWEGEDLTVWASTQGTFSVRDGIAEGLGIPKSRVTVITEHMGGGFGSKFGPGSFALIAARLARQAQAPVKLMLTRKEEHLGTGNRPSAVMRLKLGGTKQGSLDAVHLVSYGTPGIGTGAGASGPIRNTYAVANFRVEETDVHTNTGPAAPFRAPGHPQGAFAYEQSIDMLAEACGLDPLEFRKKIDTHPVRLAEYDVGAEAIGWSRRAELQASGAGPLKRGIGMASALWYNTGGTGATVQVRISRDGSVEVLNGAQDIGTGTRTLIGIVAAEELGLPLSAITVRLGRTEWPEGPASGGSTTTPTLIPAVRAAAFEARKQLLAIAARLLEVEAGSVAIEQPGPMFVAQEDPKKRVTFKQVAGKIPGEVLTAQGSRAEDYEGYNDKIAGVQFAEVEVDTGTGKVRVVKVVAVQDCGRVINPLLAESQINGGVIQGLSFALFEDRILDPATGRMLNPNLEQYKIAGSLDIPEIVAIPFTAPSGFNNAGVLGLGEPPVVPTAGAIANAFYHATGVRMLELPMTPARVVAALAGGRRA